MAGFQRKPYGNSNSNQSNTSRQASAPKGNTSGDVEGLVYSGGLFAPKPGSKSKAVASGRVKEEIVIPAGAFINLYEVDPAKLSDAQKAKGMTFRIMVREPLENK